MTSAGWIFMLVSILCVLSLVIFCFHRVLNVPHSTDHMHAPLDIDTLDADNDSTNN